MLAFEKQILAGGATKIAGADEVGRGALAGPVVVGCVIYSEFIFPEGIVIRDSKKMTLNQREKSSKWIKENFEHSIGVASNKEIDKLGIVKATHRAYRRAVGKLETKLEHILLDAFNVPYLKDLPREKQTAIIKGDSKSFLIAAASIIAKVYRDNLMVDLSTNPDYNPYLWAKNKGYGTANHRRTLKKIGSSKLHRKEFIKNFVE